MSRDCICRCCVDPGLRSGACVGCKRWLARAAACLLLCVLAVAPLYGFAHPFTSVEVEALDPAFDPGHTGRPPTGDEGWRAQPPRLVKATGSRWWRVRIVDPLAARDPGAWILSLSEVFDNRIVAYLPPDYTPRVLRLHDPRLVQRGSRQRLALRLPVEARTGWIYLEVDWVRWISIGVRALPEAAYLAEDLDRVRMLYTTLGAMLSLSLVGGLFALAMRRNVLVWFSVWVFCAAIYHLSMSGELARVLPGLSGLVSPIKVAHVSVHLGLLAAYLFVYRFLSVPQHFPRAARFYRGLLGCIGLLFLPMRIDALAPATAMVVNALLLVIAALALGLATARARRGDPQGWFFLLGWGVATVVSVLRAFHYLSLAGTPPWLELLHPAADAFAALVLILAVARAARYAEREMHLARRHARTDPLTGLANRAELDSRLPECLTRQQGLDRPVSVLFCDLDHFKSINDRFGHEVGDLCLIAAAAVLRRSVRTDDLLVRYGGEEFVLVLEGTPLEQAARIGEKIRAEVQRGGRHVAGHEVGLTISMGIAQWRPGESAEELLRRADELLYRAKAEGRNRCAVEAAGAVVPE